MKKIFGIILAVFMLATAAFAADITVTLNGEVVDCESYGSPATIVEGRTLVPLRAIFEALGASVEWDQATKTVSSTLGDDAISLAVGSTILVKNGEDITLDVPAQIINSRTMVPARAIAEAYGVGVEWDAASRTVVLTQVIEQTDDSVLFTLTGENYTGNEGFQFLAGGTVNPEILENPDDASDKVILIHSEVTEKPSWTYFRDYEHVDFKPGERYLVKFKARLEKRADDVEISQASVGICFRYGDSAEDGSFKDHGVGGSIKVFNDKWTDVAFIYTLPETLLPEVGSGFGIFGNPDQNVAISYYLDDVSLAVYTGSAIDGFHSAESLEVAEAEKSFDINSANGVVFEFDDSFSLGLVSASEKEVVDGNIVMTGIDGFNDLIVNFKNLSYAADKYSAVAVRFKADLKGVSGHQKANAVQVYFTTDTEENLSESKSATVEHASCAKDGEWLIAYVPVSTNENWNGTVTSFRVDPANDEGTVVIDKVVLVEA